MQVQFSPLPLVVWLIFVKLYVPATFAALAKASLTDKPKLFPIPSTCALCFLGFGCVCPEEFTGPAAKTGVEKATINPAKTNANIICFIRKLPGFNISFQPKAFKAYQKEAAPKKDFRFSAQLFKDAAKCR